MIGLRLEVNCSYHLLSKPVFMYTFEMLTNHGVRDTSFAKLRHVKSIKTPTTNDCEYLIERRH